MTKSNLVYLVDDDSDYQYLVLHVFKLFLPNHRIRFFSNGAELLDTIQSFQPAGSEKPIAILLDVDMPKMNGFQTLSALKQTPVWQQTEVVIMSNRDQEKYKQEAYRLGAYRFVLKPISLADIQMIMTDICEMQGEFVKLAES